MFSYCRIYKLNAKARKSEGPRFQKKGFFQNQLHLNRKASFNEIYVRENIHSIKKNKRFCFTACLHL